MILRIATLIFYFCFCSKFNPEEPVFFISILGFTILLSLHSYFIKSDIIYKLVEDENNEYEDY